MLFAMVGSAEEAHSALQDALLKCWRRRQYLGEIEDLRAWIFRMTLNAGRDLRDRTWQRSAATAGDSFSAEAALSPGGAPRDPQARIRQALATLPREEQEVFLLRQNGELGYDEIGRALKLPTGTVEGRMRLALERLQAVIPDGIESSTRE